MKKKVLFLILLLGFILSGCSKEAVDPFTLPDHGDFELVLTVKTVAGEEVTGEDLVLRLADVKEMSVFFIFVFIFTPSFEYFPVSKGWRWQVS